MSSFIVAEKRGKTRSIHNAVACREIHENGRRLPLSNDALRGQADEIGPPRSE
jgi:hypothetical protein